MAAFPPLFLSHGSPMTALVPREAGAFMQALGPRLVARFGRPRAIVAVSAHSLARQPVLLAADRHAAVYDFSGFDAALSTLRYDAPGAPALADALAARLAAAGFAAQRIAQGGLDHGIWTPLRFMFPEADVPVLPLAWPAHWAPAQLMGLGRALAPLAAEGVLVMGSGSITHNLQRVFAHGRARVDQPATPESSAFRDWFATRGAAADWPALADYRSRAPHAALMHPSDEHLLPWFIAAGAAGAGGRGGGVVPALRMHASQTYGDLGMDAYAFGPQAAALLTALGQVQTEASVPAQE
jgi:4,5-DOPA dioxygenase extradiol